MNGHKFFELLRRIVSGSFPCSVIPGMAIVITYPFHLSGSWVNDCEDVCFFGVRQDGCHLRSLVSLVERRADYSVDIL